VPVYRVKPEQQQYPTAVEPSAKKKKSYPSVTIPVSKEILDALEVGGQVVVELKGTVRGLESRQSTDNDPYSNRNELRMELRVVKAYPGEDAEEESDEKEPDMKEAIDKGLGYSK